MLKKRRGSILFTAVGMVAVFLTLVVTSVAYVESTNKASMDDRWRDTAEQAARSGLEWVMGYAQANIDQENRLPKAWAEMQDGEVINPVAQFLNNVTTVTTDTDLNNLYSTNPMDTSTGVGDMLGACTAAPATRPDGVGEFILSRTGNYIVTFKARVQQYSYGNLTPRQYRIGVVGRVRRAMTGFNKRNGAVNTDERGTVVAERFLLCNVGQEPTSRYAALIDIDGVKNWVPGEVVDGPLHINRGYVDSQTETTDSSAARSGTQFINLGVTQGNFYAQSVATSAGAVNLRDLRSIMNIRTAGNSPFQPVYDSEIPATLNGPRFNDEVTMTVVNPSDPDVKKYRLTNFDPTDPTYGVCGGADPTHGVAVQVDGKAFCAATLNAEGVDPSTMFMAPENRQGDKHFGVTAVNAAPHVLDYPVTLPHSVRNRIGAAVGYGQSLAGVNFWNNIQDGVYVPTPNWWNQVGNTTLSNGNEYMSVHPSGGIYIRGNVEVMRMGVTGTLSYYLFTLGYGGTANTDRRTYAVIADRANRCMWMCAWAPGVASEAVPGIGVNGGSGGTTLGALLGGGVPSYPTATVPGFTQVFNAGAFANRASAPGINPGKICAYFPPGSTDDKFPFNGVVFVDISKDDASRNANPYLWNNIAPITGNVFALGDPGINNTATDPAVGVVTGLPALKRSLDGNAEERVATYIGGTASGPATSLTILAAGNVFIQNSIALQSLAGVAGIARYPGFTFNDTNVVSLDKSHDLLGIVADKQVVVGLTAPNSSASRAATSRGLPGVVIHAAIAALGDPAYDYKQQQADPKMFSNNNPYRGSFATEGLMQYYNVDEHYGVCDGGPNAVFCSAGGYTNYASQYSGGTPAISRSVLAETTVMQPHEYPGLPLYDNWHFPLAQNFNMNPNGVGSRGRALVFGSVTVKKRGIIGKGDTSYDKRFLFDHRLLTIAPPVFPSSMDVVVRTGVPSAANGLPYWGGNAGTAAMQFMK